MNVITNPKKPFLDFLTFKFIETSTIGMRETEIIPTDAGVFEKNIVFDNLIYNFYIDSGKILSGTLKKENNTFKIVFKNPLDKNDYFIFDTKANVLLNSNSGENSEIVSNEDIITNTHLNIDYIKNLKHNGLINKQQYNHLLRNTTIALGAIALSGAKTQNIPVYSGKFFDNDIITFYINLPKDDKIVLKLQKSRKNNIVIVSKVFLCATAYQKSDIIDKTKNENITANDFYGNKNEVKLFVRSVNTEKIDVILNFSEYALKQSTALDNISVDVTTSNIELKKDYSENFSGVDTNVNVEDWCLFNTINGDFLEIYKYFPTITKPFIIKDGSKIHNYVNLLEDNTTIIDINEKTYWKNGIYSIKKLDNVRANFPLDAPTDTEGLLICGNFVQKYAVGHLLFARFQKHSGITRWYNISEANVSINDLVPNHQRDFITQEQKQLLDKLFSDKTELKPEIYADKIHVTGGSDQDIMLGDGKTTPINTFKRKTIVIPANTLTSDEYVLEFTQELKEVFGNQMNIVVYEQNDGEAISSNLYAPLKHNHDDLYVKLQSGKVLSSNDFTNELKAKLEGLKNSDLSGYLPKGNYTGTAQDLKTAIDNLLTILNSNDSSLDSLQEIVNYIKQNKNILSNLSITNISGLQNALNSKANNNHTHSEYVANNDPRLSDPRNAKDVPAWAKTTNKPSYVWDEIGNKPNFDNTFVKLSDPRLSDPRNAKDVHEWAKQPTKPSYRWTEILDKPNFSGVNLIKNSNKTITNGVHFFKMIFENDFDFVRGKTFIISYYIEVENAQSNGRIGFERGIHFQDGTTLWGHWKQFYTGDNFKGRISFVYTVPDKPIRTIADGGFHIQLIASKIVLSKPALYVGNNNTEWSVCPEDLMDYLPLSGGVMSGDVKNLQQKFNIQGEELNIHFTNSFRVLFGHIGTNQKKFSVGSISVDTDVPLKAYGGYHIFDTRNSVINPFQIPHNTFKPFFTNQQTPTSSWISGLTFKGWNNELKAWEIAGNSHVNNENNKNGLWFRQSENETTWREWQRIYMEGDPIKNLPKEGISFKNDAFSGGGDSAKIYLENPRGAENFDMVLEVGNDGDDHIHMKTPSVTGFKHNNSRVMTPKNCVQRNNNTNVGYNPYNDDNSTYILGADANVSFDISQMQENNIITVLKLSGTGKTVTFTGKPIVGESQITGNEGSTASVIIANGKAYINVANRP